MPSSDTYFTKENQPEGAGRPKGSLNISTLIKKIWSEDISDGNGQVIPKSVLAIKALMEKAEAGDVSAFKALVERCEGMPKQEIENTHNFVKMPKVTIGEEEMDIDIG